MRLRDAKPMIRQGRELVVRAHEADAETFEFVAATEGEVDTAYGPEVLRMDGCDLSRFERNPVVLDSHNRYETGAVIGRCSMQVEGSEMIATVTFADTARATQARQLVEGGFVRAVSVGFIPRRIQTLRAGETDGEVNGPCRIIHEWELIELSLVPVPADADALARSHYFQAPEAEETPMQLSDVVGTPQERAAEMPSAPTPSPEGKVTKFEEIGAERAAREITARNASIREIAPKGHDDLAERLIVEGVSVDEARVRFLSAMQNTTTPVGTPEPAAANPKPAEQSREIDSESFLRGLLSL